ncbi:hypothetical protein [Corallococcus sicarius]|nr:hypothetical protein [Corallococcus sicarius]
MTNHITKHIKTSSIRRASECLKLVFYAYKVLKLAPEVLHDIAQFF